MSLREVEVAQVMDGDQAGARMDEGQDMGRDKECVRQAAGHLPGEAQVGPQARAGDKTQVCAGEDAGRRRTAQVEAEAVRAVERQ